MNADQQRTWATLAKAPASYYVRASDEERQIMRDWLTGLMRERIVNLTFDKADGTERTMPCTLLESVLPPIKTSGEKSVKYNPDVCKVFDPDRQVWRSFRWDRLKRIEFKIGQ
jgi:hypothetical protein